MPSCQHKVGAHSNRLSWHDAPEVVFCGKPATHVAEYHNRPKLYLCKKHAKSRLHVKELSSTNSSVD